MFCTNCGSELKDGMSFCSQCGASVAKKKTTKGKKIVVCVIVIMVLVFVAILSLKFIGIGGTDNSEKTSNDAGFSWKLGNGNGGFDSPEEAFDAYLNGFCSEDFEKMLKAYPDFIVEYNGGKKELLEKIKNNYQADMAEYIETGYITEYSVLKSEMYTEEQVEQCEESLSLHYDKEVELEEGANIYYRIYIYQDGELLSQSGIVIGGEAIKYQGKWYYTNSFSEEAKSIWE